jgi:hypothetical protein
MADLGGSFNAQEVAPLGDRTPIPAGEYRCAIVKSEWKDTANGRGKYLEFTFQILEGEQQGRMIWSRLNLQNQNAQAVQIARSELSSICRAVAKMEVKDSSEMHDIPLMVAVTVKKREDNGEPTNEVKGYRSVAVVKGQVATAAAGSPKPAWM